MTRHGTARHNTVGHGTTRQNTVRHDTARHDTTRYGTTLHGTTRQVFSKRVTKFNDLMQECCWTEYCTGPGAHQVSVQEIKRQRRRLNYSHTSRTEVKERVRPHQYPPSVISWCVIKRTSALRRTRDVNCKSGKIMASRFDGTDTGLQQVPTGDGRHKNVPFSFWISRFSLKLSCDYCQALCTRNC